jgi:hypothetical protein
VVVVDNASADGTQDMVRNEFPAVELIANADNRGFAAANNQGLAVARSDFVLLLNPDTVILDGAIDRMLAWIADRSDVGCAGCQVFETPERIQRTCFSDPGPLNLIIAELGLSRFAHIAPFLGRYWYDGWDRRSERDVEVVSGMFMLMPRGVLDKVGPLDEDFFIYAEEADLCLRIRKAGYRCVFTPTGRILHLEGGGKSTAQIRPRMHVQMHKSHLIYVRKHQGIAAYGAMRLFYLATATLRLGLFGVLGLFRPSAERRAQVTLAKAAFKFHATLAEPGR